MSDLHQSVDLGQGHIGMRLENDLGRFGWTRQRAAPGPIDGDVFEEIAGSRGLTATVLIQRNIDLPLEAPGFVPVGFAVSHQNQPGVFALIRQRLQVCGAVQAFDLHLGAVVSWPDVEDRKGGVVDAETPEAVVGFPQQHQHQAAQDGVVGHHQHRVVAVGGMALQQLADEAPRLFHQLRQWLVARTITTLELQLHGPLLPDLVGLR